MAVLDLGFGVWGAGCRVQGVGCRVKGVGLRVLGLRCRVEALGNAPEVFAGVSCPSTLRG